MIRIILVDDHVLVRNGIKMLLDTHPEIEVIAEMENGKDVLSFLQANNNSCEMVITDINMPEMDGFELAESLLNVYPTIKVVFLSMLSEQEKLLKAFRMGATGYLVKNVNYEELFFAIDHIHKGGKYLCSELSQKLIEYLNDNPNFEDKGKATLEMIEINERELEVLFYISEGFTNNEIANNLFLSKRTVEGLRQSLIDKTGSKNSASLIKYAVLNGLIT